MHLSEARTRKPRSARALALLFSITATFGAEQAGNRPSAARPASTVNRPAKPSLDALLTRVDAYWSSLAAGKTQAALSYVAASHRDRFRSRQMPPFSNPRVTAIELSPDRK